VVSGAEGKFSFPASKLALGKYALRIRATTEKFRKWPLPAGVRYFAPCDVVRDKQGKIWTAGMKVEPLE
jgi:hypothetical protein